MEMVKLNSLDEFENLPETSWKIKQPLDSDDSHDNALNTGCFLKYFKIKIEILW